MADATTKKPAPAYASYKAFTRFLRGLEDGHIPTRIDRSFLTGMSGSAQSALQNTLLFLGLMDENEKPTNWLEQLVKSTGDDRRVRLQTLLRKAYEFLFHIDLERTTTGEVHELFRKQNVSGSTAAKAIAFFLAAAKDAQIPISKNVRPPSVVKSTSSGKRQASRSVAEQDEDEDQDTGGGGAPAFAPDVHPALAGILMQLPPPGHAFSAGERKRFMAAFDAVLTLVYANEDDE